MKWLLVCLLAGLALVHAQAPPRTRSQAAPPAPVAPTLVAPLPLTDQEVARVTLLSTVMVEVHTTIRVQDLVVRPVPFSAPPRTEELLSPSRPLADLAEVVPPLPQAALAAELSVQDQKLVASGSGWVIRSCELTDGRLPGEADFTLVATNRHVIVPILNSAAPVTTAFPTGTGRVYPPEAYLVDRPGGSYRLIPSPEATCTEEGRCRQFTVSGGVAYLRFNTGRLFGLGRDEASEPALAQVVFVQGTRDLAVLKVMGVCGIPAIPWGDDRRLTAGDPVFLAGASLGFPFSFTTGTYQGPLSIFPVIEEALRHTAPANPGSSGGPLVVQQEGRVAVVGQERFALLTPVGAYGLTFAQGENGATRAGQLRAALFVGGFGYATGLSTSP